jgi:hypothetical protein
MKTTTYQTPPQRPCHAIWRGPSPKLHDWNNDFVGELTLEDGHRYRVSVTLFTSRLYGRPQHLQKTLLGLLEPTREGSRASCNFDGAKTFRLLGHFPRLAGRSPKACYSSLWDISLLPHRNLGGAR